MLQSLDAEDKRGLLLGVTPELAGLAEDMVAIDRNSAMINDISQGKVVYGQWLELPFPDASFDFAVGDGSLNMLHYLDDYRLLFGQLKKALKSQAKIIFRVFTAPEESENVDGVFNAAFAGGIGSFHAFKWRLAMAMVAENGEANIKVGQIYKVFNDRILEREKLAKASGWLRQDIDTIDVYEDSDVVYSFPTLAQLRMASSELVEEVSITHGNYELAECCPVITLRLR